MPADTTSPPTSREGVTTDLVESYWRDIRNYEPLSRAEEAQLVRRARAGDTAAADAMVTANLRFVVTVAKKYTSYGMSFSELIAEGNCGLLEASSASTRPAASNLSPTPCGGSGRRFSRRWPSRVGRRVRR